MTVSPALSGVITTGIYCREGCPGRPRRRNVRAFSLPAAAEAAGFRACYRCRPDRMPPPVGFDGAPPILDRALKLINEGALDGATEEELGQRLSISGRHLRRLFLQHIGATTDFVARSRRAHFARRLLDETDLSMSGIAFSAGFSSVRQMNRAMLETFRATPSDLRSRRRSADRLAADGGIVLRLPYHPLFDFSAMLDFLRPRAIPGVEHADVTTYRRTIETCGNPGLIEVTNAGDDQHLILKAHLPTIDSLIDDVARVRRIFGLDQASAAWFAPLASDPLLAPLVARRPGLRLPGAWDPFEVAVRIILGQRISVKAASTISGRLVERCGAFVPGVGSLGINRVFPPAQRLAQVRLSQLNSLGITTQRAETIRALARAYVSGDLSLDNAVPLDRTLQALLALPGVGPWTANFIALRATGHLDAFPAGDLGLRRNFARLDNRSNIIPTKELLDRAEAWRPYRAIAAVQLWAA